MNIIELNLLKEELQKENFADAFDRETISNLIETAEHAEKLAQKNVSHLVNMQARTIDSLRTKIELVVERMCDLQYPSPNFEVQDFVYELLKDIYINNIAPEELDHDKIERVSSEFQRKYNN